MATTSISKREPDVLNPEDAELAEMLMERLPSKVIQERFGLSQSQVSRIKHGLTRPEIHAWMMKQFAKRLDQSSFDVLSMRAKALRGIERMMDAVCLNGEPHWLARLGALNALARLWPPALIAEVIQSEHSGLTAADCARYMSSLGGSHIERIRALLTQGAEMPDMVDVVPWKEEDEPDYSGGNGHES